MMKDFSKKQLLTATTLAALFIAPSAFATNGYFSHGYSLKEKGVAGAGVASSQDALAAATNPAGMVMVGDRLDVGAVLFSPIREYEVKGLPSGAPGSFPLEPGTIESDSNYFLIPNIGWNMMLDGRSSIGVSVYGNGGMNTDYPAHSNPIRNGGGTCPSGTFCVGETGVDLGQLFVSTTYARKFGEGSSWGASLILAYQWFEAKGLDSFGFFSLSPSDLSNNDHDTSWGYGVKLGIQSAVTKALTLGASYQSRIYMTEFDDYKGLFAEDGDFDIPPTATIGLALKTSDNSQFLLDVQRIWYSDVAAVGNPFNPAFSICGGSGGGAGGSSRCLGGSKGAGFGWEDMTIVKLGFLYQSSPDWLWRVGFSKGDQPIPSSEVLFNVLAPAVIEEHVTFGFTKTMSKGSELTFSAMYAPPSKVSGPNQADPVQKITLEMYQYEFGVAWGWKF
jgi:long-chain fatty acid transport protein